MFPTTYPIDLLLNETAMDVAKRYNITPDNARQIAQKAADETYPMWNDERRADFYRWIDLYMTRVAHLERVEEKDLYLAAAPRTSHADLTTAMLTFEKVDEEYRAYRQQREDYEDSLSYEEEQDLYRRHSRASEELAIMRGEFKG